MEGSVEMNGEAASWDKLTRTSGYVQQDDLFIPTLTVKEHLTYMVHKIDISCFDCYPHNFSQAMLTMGKDHTTEVKREKIVDTLNQFNLVKSQDTLIGSKVIKGISGGEKRRLAFASAILTDPQLLFCDEPTSGLGEFVL